MAQKLAGGIVGYLNDMGDHQKLSFEPLPGAFEHFELSYRVTPPAPHDLKSAVHHIETAIRFAKSGIGPTPAEAAEWALAMNTIRAACGVQEPTK